MSATPALADSICLFADEIATLSKLGTEERQTGIDEIWKILRTINFNQNTSLLFCHEIELRELYFYDDNKIGEQLLLRAGFNFHSSQKDVLVWDVNNIKRLQHMYRLLALQILLFDLCDFCQEDSDLTSTIVDNSPVTISKITQNLQVVIKRCTDNPEQVRYGECLGTLSYFWCDEEHEIVHSVVTKPLIQKITQYLSSTNDDILLPTTCFLFSIVIPEYLTFSISDDPYPEPKEVLIKFAPLLIQQINSKNPEIIYYSLSVINDLFVYSLKINNHLFASVLLEANILDKFEILFANPSVSYEMLNLLSSTILLFCSHSKLSPKKHLFCILKFLRFMIHFEDEKIVQDAVWSYFLLLKYADLFQVEIKNILCRFVDKEIKNILWQKSKNEQVIFEKTMDKYDKNESAVDIPIVIKQLILDFYGIISKKTIERMGVSLINRFIQLLDIDYKCALTNTFILSSIDLSLADASMYNVLIDNENNQIFNKMKSFLLTSNNDDVIECSLDLIRKVIAYNTSDVNAVIDAHLKELIKIIVNQKNCSQKALMVVAFYLNSIDADLIDGSLIFSFIKRILAFFKCEIMPPAIFSDVIGAIQNGLDLMDGGQEFVTFSICKLLKDDTSNIENGNTENLSRLCQLFEVI